MGYEELMILMDLNDPDDDDIQKAAVEDFEPHKNYP